MGRVDGYAPIRDYAAIGDGRTVALVARDGSVDWLCLPNVDSPAVFARLLDAERGGSFRLEPTVPYEAERSYRERSNVLETTFTTADGRVRVTDAMTLTDIRRISPMRELVRKVEALAGTVPLRWRFEPRFGYARAQTRIERRADRWFATAAGDAVVLGVCDADAGVARGEWVEGELLLAPGQSALLSLAGASREPAVMTGRDDAERRLERTIRFWPEWVGGAEYDGSWGEAVARSALVLKLLTFAPSGAIIAAPTTSLPEWIGGSRNWDYRFTWLRDASWTLDAMLRLGFRDEAHAFFWWLMHASRLTQPRLQILYRTDGSVHTEEQELDHFAGYRGSAPVRIGNGARDQEQLDLYGAVLEAIWLYGQEVGRLDGDTGKEVAKIADYVAKHWRDRDNGIWEVRDERTHYIQSKALCWVALDRACKLAESGLIPDGHRRWRSVADEVRAFVDEEGWDEELQSYVRAPEMRELDGSLLTLALLGFHHPRGERIQGLIAAVERELRDGPYVYRYRGGDGLSGEEGAFLTCSFWLVDAYARSGRLDDANALMEELLGLANDVGLYSEEIDPSSRELLGNFPQGLTHLALINAAVSIADAEGELRERAA
ncbi:MAG TPA: glycoside hydrolase family 15 protein [Gaiellaceae bacterium]|nr:glycoside hydrolase family 15 protein [Gaiellaceae bacterium]